MIADNHAELLNLPPATPVEEAQRHCEQMLERLRLNIDALPPAHQILPDLDSRKAELEAALSTFETQTQSALEQMLDQGMACLMAKPPDYPGAGKFYASAEKAATGKTLPPLTRRRMQVFKQTLDEAKAQLLRANFSATMKRVAGLLAQEPPGIPEAREKMGILALALRQNPDPALRVEFDSLRKLFQEREKRFTPAKLEARPEPPRTAPTEIPRVAAPVLPEPVDHGTQEKAATQAALDADPPPAAAPESPPATESAAESSLVSHPEPDAPPQEPPGTEEIPSQTDIVGETDGPLPDENAQPPLDSAPANEPPPPQPPPIPRPNPEEPTRRTKLLIPVIAVIVVFMLVGIGFAVYLKIKSAHQTAAAEQNSQSADQPSSAPPVAAVAPIPTTPLPAANPAPTPAATPPTPKPAPPPELGELTITVKPETADLFTNGVSMGHPHYPVVLRGTSQGEVSLRASLDGYASESLILVFPSHGAQMQQTFELQPKLAVLLVQSDPPATEILLQRPGGKAVKVKAPREGIGFTPGVPVNATIEMAGYEPATVQVPALKPGERHEVLFGKLRTKAAGSAARLTTAASITPESKHPIPAPPTAAIPSTAEVDQALRETIANIDTVKPRLPLTDASRRKWSDWIKQLEARFKGDAKAWVRLKGPVEQLRELINTTKPAQHSLEVGGHAGQ